MGEPEFSILLLMDTKFERSTIEPLVIRAEKKLDTTIKFSCVPSLNGLIGLLDTDNFHLYLTTGRTYADDIRARYPFVKCFPEVCGLIKKKNGGSLESLVYVPYIANIGKAANDYGVKIWQQGDLAKNMISYFSKLREAKPIPA